MGGAVWQEKELVSPAPSLICTTSAPRTVNRNEGNKLSAMDNESRGKYKVHYYVTLQRL